jgi:hypothetical protein
MTGMIVACVEKDSERGRLAKSNAHISFEFFFTFESPAGLVVSVDSHNGCNEVVLDF